MSLFTRPEEPLTREVVRQRGPIAYYRPGMGCPCCGWRAFYVGRSTAESAHCEAVMPLAHGVQ